MKLLMLIKTSGLDYDDRLRKEALSLQALGCCVKIAALEYANRAERREVYSPGISAQTICLYSRQWLKRAGGLSIKTVELYMHLLTQVIREKPAIVWVHNLELGGLIPLLALLRKLGYIKQIIWDQHELPSDATLANPRQMSALGRLMNLCDAIVMANEERHSLVRQILGERRLHIPLVILHNYPDAIFTNLPHIHLSQSINDWLQDSPYVLAQGGANPDRHLRELVDAIMQQPTVKLIVVGPYEQSQINEFDLTYGDAWHRQIRFTGFVPQLEITPYIDHAIASVVFYMTTNSNSRLCAPNRLYQALSRGTPVIVGTNPPMMNLVEERSCGLVVNHEDPNHIRQGIETLQTGIQAYRRQATNARPLFVWESQNKLIQEIIHLRKK